MVRFKKSRLTTFVKHLILWFIKTLQKPSGFFFLIFSYYFIWGNCNISGQVFVSQRISDKRLQMPRQTSSTSEILILAFFWLSASRSCPWYEVYKIFFSVIRLNNTLCSFSLVQERRWGKLIEPPINFFQTCLSNGTETETFEDKNALFLRHTGLEKPRHYRWVPDHAKKSEYNGASIQRFSDIFFLEYIACTLMSCQVWEVLT